MGKHKRFTDDDIINASKCSISASAAAEMIGISPGAYKRHASRLGVFITNQAGKGMAKPINDYRKINLKEILEGKHPSYQTNKLRMRLLSEGIKEHRCEMCYITEWMNKPAPLELDHIDGDRYNHKISNLRLLCPNCHSQTDTYCGRNKKSMRLSKS